MSILIQGTPQKPDRITVEQPDLDLCRQLQLAHQADIIQNRRGLGEKGIGTERNRELAVERLVEQLRNALKVERRRIATKPTAASRERRLEEKRRRSRTKRLRSSRGD